MGIFNRRKKNVKPEPSFYELAQAAEAHEDCLILVAVPNSPYTPDEADINEEELGRVIFAAIDDYLAEVQERADFAELCANYSDEAATI